MLSSGRQSCVSQRSFDGHQDVISGSTRLHLLVAGEQPAELREQSASGRAAEQLMHRVDQAELRRAERRLRLCRSSLPWWRWWWLLLLWRCLLFLLLLSSPCRVRRRVARRHGQ